jgi:nitroreductase
MSIAEMIKSRRTIRRFQPRPIDHAILLELADAGRLAPSAQNLQPLAFLIVDDPSIAAQIFPLTKWAGYLPEDQGRPPADQEPVAYLFILIDRRIRPEGGEMDVGAAAENIILLAMEKGIGSCWLGSVNKSNARRLLSIPEAFELAALLALGYPDESPVVEPLTGSVKYYKDDQGRLHVPKRTLTSVFYHNHF